MIDLSQKSNGELDADILKRERPMTWRDGIITAATLQNMPFPAVRYVLPGYIPEGLTILAGKPKAGKSWFALDLAIAVASGRFTLGTLKPPQGNVLYLALEDNPRRLKRRIAKILGEQTPWPPCLTLKTQWRRTDAGGITDISEWVAEAENPRLVIIDTLERIRPMTTGKAQAYTSDYQAIEGLQKLAGDCGLAVLVVHHVRKMEADDPFDTISGTLGLTGAADTILVLKRQSGSMTLFARGRDIEELETALQFSKETCRWSILGDAADVHRSAERTAILQALRGAGAEGMSVNEIMAATSRGNRQALDVLLFKMKDDAEIVRVKRGVYALPESKLADVGKIGKKERSEEQSIDNAKETVDLTNLTDLNGGKNGSHNPPALGPPGDSLDDFDSWRLA